jgi:hypothetical protein
LLDFDHFYFLEDLKTMAAGSEQNDIPCLKFAAFEIGSVVSIKIHPQAASAQKQYLTRKMNGAMHRIMDMRLNDVARGVAHITKLLGELAGRKKMDTWLVKAAAKYDGEFNAVKAHALDHGATPK